MEQDPVRGFWGRKEKTLLFEIVEYEDGESTENGDLIFGLNMFGQLSIEDLFLRNGILVRRDSFFMIT